MKIKILLLTLFTCLGIQAQTTNLQGNVYHVKPFINVNDTTAVKLSARRNTDGRDVSLSWSYLASVIGSAATTPTLQQVATAGNTTTLPLYADFFGAGTTLYKNNQINYGSGSTLQLPDLSGSFYVGASIRRDGITYYADSDGLFDIGNTAITIDDVPTFGSGNAASSGGVFDALALKFDNPTGTLLQYVNGTGGLTTFPTLTNGTVTNVIGSNGVTVSNGTTTPNIGLGNITPLTVAATGTVSGANLSGTNTGDNSVNTNSNAYTNAQISALTTDAVPSTTTNKYVTVGATQPTTANTLKLVTTNTITPNTDGTGSQSKGVFAQLDGLAASLTQNQRVFSTAKWTGDGNMLGASLTTGQSYREKVSNQLGYTMLDNTTSGTRIIDKYKGLLDTDIAEIRFIGLGVNDMRQYGTTSASSFANFMRGLILSAYTSTAVKGQQMTLSGTDWSPDTLQADSTTGITTTNNGATATFKRIGTSIYLTIALVTGGNATYTVTIDGFTQTVLANNDSGLISATGYPVTTGAVSVAYYPYTHRFSGLTSGEHTVVITKTGGTSPLRVIWALSNGQLPSNMTYSGVAQYVIPVSKLIPGVAGVSGYAFFGGSDAAVDAYNTAEKNIIYEFNDDGLNVRLLDINTIFSPTATGYTQANGFNFTALANTNIANFLISNLTAYPVRFQQKLDRLDEYLATKLSMADLSDYARLSVNNTFVGLNTFTSSVRVAGVMNSAASTTQGSIAQSTSTVGWGFVRNLTTGFAGYARQVNSANTADIFSFENNTGQVSGVRPDGRNWGANATATNDYVTLQQMNNRNVTMVSAAYSILTTDYYVELTTGTFTLTLPTAVGVTGKEYVVANGGTGVMTLATTGGQTISGSATKTYNTQWGGVRVISNGTNWRINGSF